MSKQPDPTGDPYAAQRLTLQGAAENPCLACSAPCCTYLPLKDITIATWTDVDYGRYLLNFERIQLAMVSPGQFRIHLSDRCTHLRDDNRCGIHNTPAQPTVCKSYSAYSCGYKTMFNVADRTDFVRMDRARFEMWASHLVFDGHRRIIQSPDIEQLLPLLPPMAPQPERAPVADPEGEKWRAEVAAEVPASEPSSLSVAELSNPCGSCSAYCCDTLSIPLDPPSILGNLDYMRFSLGYPGVEVGVGPGGWSLLIRTRCRHLIDGEQGAQCGVFGKEERPWVCSGYNEMNCAYKLQLGRPRAHYHTRFRLADFEAVLSMFRFDEHGVVTQRPDHTAVRQAIEAAWAGD